MADLIWSNGDPLSFAHKIIVEDQSVLMSDAEELMTSLVDKGGQLQQDILEAARTPTGERRVARGGISAGRHDSGEMIAAVSNQTEKTKDSVIGTWGWSEEDWQTYFDNQDNGTDRIEAAGSLPGSFITIREEFVKGVDRISKGRGF